MSSFWSWWSSFYGYLVNFFWSKEIDIALLGLQNAGKSSLLRVLSGSPYSPDSIPTVGFSMKRVRKGLVVLKCWDLGGQPRFRPMWERYCRGTNAILFVVDSADSRTFPEAKKELHALLDCPSLKEIPILVLGNKDDLPEAASVDELISQLDLLQVRDRELACYSISVKDASNIDAVVSWLTTKS